jgi:hypothetical protein
MRVLLVIPGLLLLFAGIYCLAGKGVSTTVPAWIGALACVAGFGVIIYGAGRRRF